jgi:trk system potassium uptake protein TrkA
MKVMIIGLGNYGISLAASLMEAGNEVIGVDNSPQRVEFIKDQITYAVIMDATNETAVRSLPFKDLDVAIVAIGENEGAAILTTAILKKIGVKRIISRSISGLHQMVLEAMGIDEIVHPEQESADRLSKMLHLKWVLNNFELDEHYSVTEIQLNKRFEGQTVEAVNFRKNFSLNIVTIIREHKRRNILGGERSIRESIGVIMPETTLLAGDILVVFGANNAISAFCNLTNPES